MVKTRSEYSNKAWLLPGGLQISGQSFNYIVGYVYSKASYITFQKGHCVRLVPLMQRENILYMTDIIGFIFGEFSAGIC
jgi:hypothetical protein